jgi:hypothetical protein
MSYRFFSSLFIANVLLMTMGCSTLSTTSSSDSENNITAACANSPVLIADLTQHDFLKQTQLPDGRLCTSERV